MLIGTAMEDVRRLFKRSLAMIEKQIRISPYSVDIAAGPTST
jgi:hypothetical protein